MQNYTIPTTLANKLAKKDARMLRNSLRLWFFLKTVDGLESKFYLSEVRPFLLEFFSYRNINVYFDFLIRNGWAGRDRFGKIYLRGRNHLFNVCGRKSKMLSVEVSNADTQSLRAWSAFLAGVQVCGVQRAINRNTDKVRIVEASTSLSGGDSRRANSPESPVSCENLVLSLGISRATASRLRQRAHRGNHITNRWAFQETPFKATSRSAMLAVRGEVASCLPSYPVQRLHRLDSVFWPIDEQGVKQRPDAWCANALVMSRSGDGSVWMQRPNMVSNLSIIFKCISRKKTTLN